MGDQRDHGRQNTHDTGSPAARPRDDLRTGSEKKAGDQRNDDRDRIDRDKDKEDDDQK